MESAAQQKAIRQYLLGLLSPEEWTELEERLLADGAFYEELLIEEDELVDQYLSGELSVAESESFRTHFLCTAERRQKLSFGAALKKHITFPEPEPLPRWRVFSLLHIPSPMVGYALAAAALVILCGSAWLIFKNAPKPGPHDIFIAVLTSGQVRSDDRDETKTFTIPPGKDTVRLQLELLSADDYQVYRAVLQDTAGTVLVQQDNLKTQLVSGRSAIILDVPVDKLPAGYFQVKLKGITAGGKDENAGSYPFKVSR